MTGKCGNVRAWGDRVVSFEKRAAHTAGIDDWISVVDSWGPYDGDGCEVVGYKLCVLDPDAAPAAIGGEGNRGGWNDAWMREPGSQVDVLTLGSIRLECDSRCCGRKVAPVRPGHNVAIIQDKNRTENWLLKKWVFRRATSRVTQHTSLWEAIRVGSKVLLKSQRAL